MEGHVQSLGWAKFAPQASTLNTQNLSAGEPKYQNYFHRASAIPALGSSGAVNGIVMFDILLFPSSTVIMYGVVPMPAWGLGALFLSFDIYGALGVNPHDAELANATRSGI